VFLILAMHLILMQLFYFVPHVSFSHTPPREALLDDITSASILTWRHVNLHGTYDFSNLTAANDTDYSLEEVIAFKAA
jgi:hypothetical protein